MADSNTIYKNSRSHMIGKMYKVNDGFVEIFILLIFIRSIMHDVFRMHFFKSKGAK